MTGSPALGGSLASFEELLAEGESVPVEGWDFSWFDGRATEERPAWGYSGLLNRALPMSTLQVVGDVIVARISPASVLIENVF